MNAPRAFHRASPLRLVSADVRLIDRISPEFALKHSVLPMRRNGAVTLVATPSAQAFRKARPRLEAALGPVVAIGAAREDITAALARTHAAQLAHRATTRTAEVDSFRAKGRWRALFWLSLTFSLIATALVWAPSVLMTAVIGWVTVTLVAITGLRTAGAVVQLRSARQLARNWRSRRARQVDPLTLPRVSLLLPLFEEGRMLATLLERLERIEYPRDRLEAILILEATDRVTPCALRDVALPDWVRVLTLPPGEVQTKPRALNFALDFASGDVIGIYDAEDAPAPDQLHLVAEAFAQAPENVACLQGVLDFYNARQSWLTRCFTIDYAAWFRLILPGLVRLGFAIPLGGTTVFFKRDVLEAIGRWDAHNVTEDADLGIRLARRGYATAFIPSVTMEEATSDVRSWVKQRSRWIKGYAMTWAVHMRRPVQLYRELGARRFWGFQVLFLGALSQFMLAPLLWSFWLLVFGLPHPITGMASQTTIIFMAALFFATEVMTIAVLALAVATPRHRRLIWWVPVMHLYFPLSAIATWKAASELATRPFFWDKTTHGQSLPASGVSQNPRLRPA
ncbi:MAG: glycosyltransferase family 2 protein [Pseudomonadota bacterium]